MQQAVREPEQESYDAIVERLHQTDLELKTIKERIEELQKRIAEFQRVADSQINPHG